MSISPPDPELPYAAVSNPAMKDGVWMSDGSRHVLDGQLKRPSQSGFTVTAEAQKGFPTLRVAYFFSGIARKASIGNALKSLCEKEGYGLELEEVDILVGGSEHDLLSKEAQDNYIAEVEEGFFDVQILSPPCGTWSRANWADDKPPQPCRDRAHPWGLPNQLQHQQRRASK